MIKTNCCGAEFSGLNAAHCSACHETFTTARAFDSHRRGSHAKNARHCIKPDSAGLVKASRPYPCWGYAPKAPVSPQGLDSDGRSPSSPIDDTREAVPA